MNTIKKLLGLLDQQMKNVNFVFFTHLKLIHDDLKKFLPSEQHETKKNQTWNAMVILKDWNILSLILWESFLV